MSDERPNRRGSTPAERAPGYRGALPPRGDALARPWVAVVVAAFVLMFVLAFVGVPSRFFPAPTVRADPLARAELQLQPGAEHLLVRGAQSLIPRLYG